jgi:hypothetical protein
MGTQQCCGPTKNGVKFLCGGKSQGLRSFGAENAPQDDRCSFEAAVRGSGQGPLVVGAKEGCDCDVAFVFSPAGGCGVPEDVGYVCASAVLEEQANDFDVAASGGLMEWSGVRMATDGVKAVGIFACVEEQTNNL